VIQRSPSLDAGRIFELSSAPLTIGRAQENAIPLAADEYASARHARVEPMRDGVWVVDLGSRNGTSVNGRVIDGRERLQEGDLVRVGETEMRVER
jgi:pSer/pThr/pTyr-binding forkhead associated (FHA) protein